MEDPENSNDEDGRPKKRPKTQPIISNGQAQANQITRGDKGIIMPARNAFDFVEVPRQSNGLEFANQVQGAKGHEKIKKVMNGIKRLSKVNNVNRKLRTVKADI